MFKQHLKYIAQTITIEPVIFLFMTGYYILLGSQIPTNIIIFKICHIETNHTKEVCDNVQDYPDVQNEVQIRVNNFLMISQWISSIPILIYAIYAGALSDEFGRKPLLTLPILGFILSFIVGIINYIFLDTLPLEFFYLDSISSMLGGFGIYYLGMYGYGAAVSKPEERALRLARLDGVETVATILGTLLSPQISKYLGYLGNYGICTGLTTLAFLYLKFIVKEPIKRQKSNPSEGKKKTPLKSYLIQFLVTPILNMASLIMKKRKRILNLLIGLQLFIYFTYIFAYQSGHSVLYLYMLKVFESFTDADYAYFSVYINCLNAFFLMVFMPIASGKFQISDSVLLLFISIIESISYIVSPFTENQWLFYAAQGLSSIGYCKYSLARSRFSKCVESNEVGKMFSVVSVLNSIAHIICNPVVKQLYNATISNFPGAYLLLSAALFVVGGWGNLILYAKQDKLHAESPIINQSVETSEDIEISTIEFTRL